VGGRLSLVGAVYGALIVNASKTIFSESFPDLWLFLMAALFIGVTMAFPLGLAGLFESHVKPWWVRSSAERHKIRARLKELENSSDEAPTLDEQNATASAMAVPANGPDSLVMRRSSI